MNKVYKWDKVWGSPRVLSEMIWLGRKEAGGGGGVDVSHLLKTLHHRRISSIVAHIYIKMKF